jgi:2-phosphosulfolactate phosphatase
LGAGAILAQLTGSISPEGDAAREAFLRHSASISDIIAASASGRELSEQGWTEDVALATQFAVSSSAPVLYGDAYEDVQAIIRSPAI